MDNWYTSPILFYNLRCVDTGACGTSRYRRGYPEAMFKEKLKKKGDSVTMHGNKMVVMRIFDRKAFCIASTVYPGRMIDTGKTHWQTKEVIQRACMVINYNKYMGGELTATTSLCSIQHSTDEQ